MKPKWPSDIFVQHRHTGYQAALLRGQKAELSTTQGQHRSRNKKVLFGHLFCFCSLSLVPPRKKTLISHFTFIFLPHFPMAGKVWWRSLPKASNSCNSSAPSLGSNLQVALWLHICKMLLNTMSACILLQAQEWDYLRSWHHEYIPFTTILCWTCMKRKKKK